jgi:hypothetical protein
MGTTYMSAQNDGFVRKQFIATSIPKKAWSMTSGGTFCPSTMSPVAHAAPERRRKPKFRRDVSILFRPDDVAHRRELSRRDICLIGARNANRHVDLNHVALFYA